MREDKPRIKVDPLGGSRHVGGRELRGGKLSGSPPKLFRTKKGELQRGGRRNAILCAGQEATKPWSCNFSN